MLRKFYQYILNMIERIKEFIENQGISVRSFEQRISASNGLIRKAIANNTDIQSKWITNIVENYPQISPDWLLTGQGNMLRNTEHFTALLDNQPSNPDIITLLKEQVKEQQTKITEQAIEIGMLRERLKLIEEERKLSEDAEAAGVAAVG